MAVQRLRHGVGTADPVSPVPMRSGCRQRDRDAGRCLSERLNGNPSAWASDLPAQAQVSAWLLPREFGYAGHRDCDGLARIRGASGRSDAGDPNTGQ
jgi:hypothetical protein